MEEQSLEHFLKQGEEANSCLISRLNRFRKRIQVMLPLTEVGSIQHSEGAANRVAHEVGRKEDAVARRMVEAGAGTDEREETEEVEVLSVIAGGGAGRFAPELSCTEVSRNVASGDANVMPRSLFSDVFKRDVGEDLYDYLAKNVANLDLKLKYITTVPRYFQILRVLQSERTFLIMRRQVEIIEDKMELKITEMRLDPGLYAAYDELREERDQKRANAEFNLRLMEEILLSTPTS